MTVEFTGFRLSQSGRSLEREDLTYALKFEEMEANNDFCQSKMIQSVPTNKKKTKGVDLTFFYLMNVDTLKMPINNWMGSGANKGLPLKQIRITIIYLLSILLT